MELQNKKNNSKKPFCKGFLLVSVQYSMPFMLFSVLCLHDDKEDSPSTLVLFNAMELICKSARENYEQNLLEYLSDLKKPKNFIETEKEVETES